MNFSIDGLTLLSFVVLALAAARTTRLVVVDAIADRPRHWVLKHFPAEGQQVSGPAPKKAHWTTTAINATPIRWVVNRGSFIGELISCPWCIGFWISCAWFGAWAFARQGTLFVALPWALSWACSYIADRV